MTYFHKIDLPCFENLLDYVKDIEWVSQDDKMQAEQICLNAAPGYTHDVTFGAGYFADKGKSDFFIRLTPEGNVRIPMKPKSVYDWELCDVFIGTPFEVLYNHLKGCMNIGRVRLLKSKPSTCMNWHIDPIPRLHYPLQTDKGCLMIIEDEVHHMPLHKWTMADTHLGYHTALNASTQERIHLVVDILP